MLDSDCSSVWILAERLWLYLWRVLWVVCVRGGMEDLALVWRILFGGVPFIFTFSGVVA
jgi:hypothetical protein